MKLRSRVVTAGAERSRAEHRPLLRRCRFSRQSYGLGAVPGMQRAYNSHTGITARGAATRVRILSTSRRRHPRSHLVIRACGHHVADGEGRPRS